MVNSNVTQISSTTTPIQCDQTAIAGILRKISTIPRSNCVNIFCIFTLIYFALDRTNTADAQIRSKFDTVSAENKSTPQSAMQNFAALGASFGNICHSPSKSMCERRQLDRIARKPSKPTVQIIAQKNQQFCSDLAIVVADNSEALIKQQDIMPPPFVDWDFVRDDQTPDYPGEQYALSNIDVFNNRIGVKLIKKFSYLGDDRIFVIYVFPEDADFEQASTRSQVRQIIRASRVKEFVYEEILVNPLWRNHPLSMVSAREIIKQKEFLALSKIFFAIRRPYFLIWNGQVVLLFESTRSMSFLALRYAANKTIIDRCVLQASARRN